MHITGEVDLPIEILQAQAEDRLVLFVGAGASIDPPSRLMMFGALANEVAADLLTRPEDLERFEGHPDRLLGFLCGSGPERVRRRVVKLLARSDSEPNANHAALSRIAKSCATPRVVTSNFDTHLETSAQAIFDEPPAVFIGPALPRGGSFGGLVLLHGSVRRPDEMVLTDADFGTAYLTEAWAARFLYAMFSEYVVVFIGYSHDDTVMNYLARGLPAEGRRFILTHTRDAADWIGLGVTPILYPARGTDHSALTKALEAWADLGDEGGLQRRSRVRDIVSTPPSAEQDQLDYLAWALTRDDGVDAFCQFARHDHWLEWLADSEAFASNWTGLEPDKASQRLADWFAEAATTVECEAIALDAIRRHRTLSSQLWISLALAASRLPQEGGLESFSTWVAVLLSQPVGLRGMGAYLTILLESTPIDGCTREFLLLWEASLRPRLVLQPSLYAFPEEQAEPQRPSAEVAWPIDDYSIEHAWAEKVKPRLSKHLHEFVAIAENALRDAHRLHSCYSGRDSDPVTFRRSAIEEHPQDADFGRREAEDVLIDTLRDGLAVVAARARLEAIATVDRWLADDIVIFRRLGLHGLGEIGASPEETVSRILEKGLLFGLRVRHEVFKQLQRVAPILPDDTHRNLLEAILTPESPDEYTERNQYELLHWLVQSGDLRSDIETHLRDIQDRNPEWIPRDDEGISMLMSGGFREPQQPIDDAAFREMLAGDAVEALSALMSVDYGPGWDQRPSWEDARAQVRNAVAARPESGPDAWRATDSLPADGRATQLKAAILNGWAAATESLPWHDVLACVDSTPDFRLLEHDIARLLESGLSGTDRLPESLYAHALALSVRLWSERIHDFEGPEVGDDWLNRGLNEWPGMVAGFWIYLASAARKGEDDHGDLESVIADLIHGAADTDRESLGGVKAVLGRELAFLDSAFEPLVTSIVFPTMSGTSTLARPYWDGFLYNPRIDLRMVRNGFGDVALAFAPAIGELTEELRLQYLAVVVRLAGAPGIDGYTYFRSAVAGLGESCRADLFAATRRSAERSDQSEREQMWTSWLGRTCHELSEGLPVSVSPADWTEFICIILGLSDSFPEAVGLAVTHPAALSSRSPLYRTLTKSGQLEAAPKECHTILLHVLSGEVDPQWSDHLLEPIIHRLGRLLGRESAASLVLAAIDAGFAHAGAWLEKFDADSSLGNTPLDDEA